MNGLDELAAGTATQRKARVALLDAQVFETLRQFRPVLAGTIPLGIDVPGSDLDVICEAPRLTDIARVVATAWPNSDGSTHVVRGTESFIARFAAGLFMVEVFAQNTPVEAQYAVLHLRVERRLLDLGGESARRQIRALKRAGLKTEPAFAKYFGLAGDPYDRLAGLARLTDEDLRRTIGM